MYELTRQIQREFAETAIGTAMVIESKTGGFLGWAIRLSDCYGVALPYSNVEPISERFHNVRLYTGTVRIEKKDHYCLLLTSSLEEYRHQFATLCADLIEPGRNGERRQQLLESPLAWWERWAELLGNAVTKKAAYSILGELLALEKLLVLGIERCCWGGFDFATHDIETPRRSFEVKSTIKRYGTDVTISSQFQLQESEVPLSLIFCRFEESLQGDSIDDVVTRLVNLGFDEHELGRKLDAYRLERGSSVRQKKFRLLEMREYEVDERFPILTAESFRGGKIPESIVAISYTIDLAGYEYTSWS